MLSLILRIIRISQYVPLSHRANRRIVCMDERACVIIYKKHFQNAVQYTVIFNFAPGAT